MLCKNKRDIRANVFDKKCQPKIPGENLIGCIIQHERIRNNANKRDISILSLSLDHTFKIVPDINGSRNEMCLPSN